MINCFFKSFLPTAAAGEFRPHTGQLPSIFLYLFPSRMGNPRNVIVHEQYVKVGSKPTKKSNGCHNTNPDDDIVRCKWCKKHQIKRKCDRMEKHLVSQCPHVPSRIKLSIQRHSNKLTVSCPEGGSNTSPAADLMRRLVKLKPAEIEEAKRIMAMFVYTSASAFRLLENKWLRQLFQLLSIPIVIPTRQQIAGPLLNEMYHKAEEENNIHFEGKSQRIDESIS